LEYDEVKALIDKKREELGIRLDCTRYLPEFRRRNPKTLDDVLNGYRSEKDVTQSKYQDAVDNAFKWFYDNGCKATIRELSEYS
jgi:hypothetical protein